MGAFAVLREQLATDLAAVGVPVHSAWPTALVLPCVFLSPPLGGDYVTAGPTFGTYTMTIDAVVLVSHSRAEVAIDALELLIEGVLANTADWTLVGVDAPTPISVTETGSEYFGTVVRLSKPTVL